jgi:hypothetical protein
MEWRTAPEGYRPFGDRLTSYERHGNVYYLKRPGDEPPQAA